MTEFVDVFGDGSDGAYNNGPLVKGRTYNFTTFNLDTAITLGGTGGKIVIKFADVHGAGLFYLNSLGHRLTFISGDIGGHQR